MSKFKDVFYFIFHFFLSGTKVHVNTHKKKCFIFQKIQLNNSKINLVKYHWENILKYILVALFYSLHSDIIMCPEKETLEEFKKKLLKQQKNYKVSISDQI